MYSVVLMMALSGGGEAVDFGHRNSCHGCSGAVVVSSCSGAVVGCSGSYGCSGAVAGYGCHGAAACSGSCHGRHGGGLFSGGGGLFSRRGGHGCHGCSGSVACYGSSGCYGGSVGCYGSSGCYGGSVGCYGGCGGTIVVPSTPGTPGTPETPKVMPKKVTSVTAPSTIVVSLPADATLTVDGVATTSTSAQRTLVTPALDTETTYVYTLRAQVNGQTLVNEVHLRGGQVIETQFSFPGQSVVSR